MLYPFFTFLMYSKRRAWLVFALTIGLYFVGIGYFQPVKGVAFGNTNILYCAPYFIVGGIIYLYRKTLLSIFNNCVYRNILRVVTIAFTTQFFLMPEYRINLFSGLTLYTLWILYAMGESYSHRKWTLLNNRITKFFSRVSMEVYLCHMMFFRVMEKIHLERIVDNGDMQYWTICICVLAMATMFSVIWKKIERRIT